MNKGVTKGVTRGGSKILQWNWKVGLGWTSWFLDQTGSFEVEVPRFQALARSEIDLGSRWVALRKKQEELWFEGEAVGGFINFFGDQHIVETLTVMKQMGILTIDKWWFWRFLLLHPPKTSIKRGNSLLDKQSCWLKQPTVCQVVLFRFELTNMIQCGANFSLLALSKSPRNASLVTYGAWGPTTDVSSDLVGLGSASNQRITALFCPPDFSTPKGFCQCGLRGQMLEGGACGMAFA